MTSNSYEANAEWSKQVAALIVDALIDAKIVARNEIGHATEIAFRISPSL
jgi:hypothetical protein